MGNCAICGKKDSMAFLFLPSNVWAFDRKDFEDMYWMKVQYHQMNLIGTIDKLTR